MTLAFPIFWPRALWINHVSVAHIFILVNWPGFFSLNYGLWCGVWYIYPTTTQWWVHAGNNIMERKLNPEGCQSVLLLVELSSLIGILGINRNHHHEIRSYQWTSHNVNQFGLTQKGRDAFTYLKRRSLCKQSLWVLVMRQKFLLEMLFTQSCHCQYI